uniref:Coiled-coil domain containing 42B n=2 Tax=Nothobranchius pienaari TaxID=704102 RepID=A0A1A8MXP0_9TELE
MTAAEMAASRKRMGMLSGVVPELKDVESAIDQLTKEDEAEELKRSLEDRKQTLQNLKQEQKELQESIREVRHNVLMKVLHSEKVRQIAEKEMKMMQEVDAETEKLKKEKATLMKRKEEMQREIGTYSPYRDFLEDVCKTSGHKNADDFSTYYRNMLSLKEKFTEERKQRQEKKEHLTKELRTVEEQKILQWLQRTNQLAELEEELKKAQSETLKWEREWSHIHTMKAERAKTQNCIKMSIQNTYEMCGYNIADVDDTTRQLKKIKTFIQEVSEITKQYQKSLQS